METLLRELCIEIFLLLQGNGKDLVTCCLVCKKWNVLLNCKENDERLWKRTTTNEWNRCFNNPEKDLLLGCSSWKIALISMLPIPASISMRMETQCPVSFNENRERADASDLNLNVVPSSILSYSISLRRLYLQRNRLTCLPPQLSILTSLTILNLANNELSCLPPQLSALTSLTILRLNNNQLHSLPPQLSTLTALKGLYLDENKLSSLPLEYSSFTNLKELTLSSNPLYTIPSPVFAFTQIKHLVLADTHLSSIPQPFFSSLTNLVSLYLSNNELSIIPIQFSTFTQLKYLHMQNNNFPKVGHTSRYSIYKPPLQLTTLHLIEFRL